MGNQFIFGRAFGWVNFLLIGAFPLLYRVAHSHNVSVAFGLSLSYSICDIRVWSIHSSGVFSCKSFYVKLIDKYGVPLFPFHKTIWIAFVPFKVNLFMWSFIRGSIIMTNGLVGEPVKAKDLLSAVKNLVCCDVNRHAESPPFLMNLWTVVKISQQAIIDLLLDIMVESCQHSETRSSVDCYDSSLKPSGHANGDASEGQFLRQSGPEDSGQSAKYETLASWVDGSSSMCAVEGLEEEITDIPEKAILAQPPSELSAIALLKINSIQDLKIKWPEQADEILDMIINSLKALDGTIPKGGLRPNQWLVSVHKISRALDRAPKHLQPDLVTLVPSSLIIQIIHLLHLCF
ncbi:uncharacterized protein LOC114290074 [Camellia sinensis]|uniref:uncharacterized protein LOC114290074 n=1 Tax=Camellia sinensis TaxID=4442 RepID=UPI0010365AAB|nr:uncharacterized protein LOC114290074 [Camellia sinensis]